MILGTAGHIDHGKTALIRALTGVDTDRLPEEKRRGITIDLGFAPLSLEGVGVIGVVDVPGHEAFVRTMVAGATGIDLALLVVAADEGVMPQTREHLQIIDLLGIRSGVVAITKRDLVEPEWLALVEQDVRQLIQPTTLAGAPTVAVSVVTGEGLEELRRVIAAAAADAAERDPDDLFRLPVDRAFTVKGTGTVVTGTVWSGSLGVDDAVRVYPAGADARVRGLQNHGITTGRIGPAARAAVALAGITLDQVERGAMLVSDAAWRPTRLMRAAIRLLDSEIAEVEPTNRFRLHLGTQAVEARLVVGPGTPVGNQPVGARVHLAEPILARAGDRFVLRIPSPARTVGGGEVQDPWPEGSRPDPWPTHRESAETRLRRIVDEAGSRGVAIADLPVRLGLGPARARALVATPPEGVVALGSRIFSAEALHATEQAVTKVALMFLDAHPLEPGAPLQDTRSRIQADTALFDGALERAIAHGSVERDGSFLRPPGWKPRLTDRDQAVLPVLREALRQAGREPPSVGELRGIHGERVPALLRLLEREGFAVPVEEDRYFDAGALEGVTSLLRSGLQPGREYSPAELRELLGVSRKYLIPLLEYCDRRGVTRRTESGRVLGT